MLKTLQKRIDNMRLKQRPTQCWPWLGYIETARSVKGTAKIWVNEEIGKVTVPRAIFLAQGIEIPDD